MCFSELRRHTNNQKKGIYIHMRMPFPILETNETILIKTNYETIN